MVMYANEVETKEKEKLSDINYNINNDFQQKRPAVSSF